MLSRLIVLLPDSTSLIHDCANPVLSLTPRWVSLAAFRALRKFRAKISRSAGTVLFFCSFLVSRRVVIIRRGTSFLVECINRIAAKV